MIECKVDYLKRIIEDVLKVHGNHRSSLLPVLIAVNDKIGFISDMALVEISKQMDIPIAEIHGVMSFYSFLNKKKKGKYVIRICRSLSCEFKGKNRIKNVIMRELGIGVGETTDDGLFTLEETNCIGMCDRSPAMLINDRPYYNLTPERAIEILESYRGGKII